MSETNPYDNTIWDHIDPEQAKEDPLHGPTAMQQLLRVPPMPLGNGYYLRPGSFYMKGTRYEDSNGRPIYFIGPRSTASFLREVRDLTEWMELSQLGEDALTALEAKRQNERMRKLGYASCFKTNDVCPGGKKLQDCPSGKEAYQAGKEWSEKNSQYIPKNGRSESVLAWAGKKCVGCSVDCDASVIAKEGSPEAIRVRFFEQSTDDSPVIKLKLDSLIASKAKLQDLQDGQIAKDS